MFDLPPIRFIATASVVCASVEIEPRLIAPVAKRLTISFAGSTSDSGTGGRTPCLNSNRPRSVFSLRPWSLISAAYSLYVAKLPERVACWSFAIESGVHMCSSPRTR